MKKTIIILYVFGCLCSCTEKKQTLQFTALPPNELKNTPFELPAGVTDSAKKAHDHCMGFSFDANAVLAGGRDTVFIGTIINRRSLKAINTIGNLGLDFKEVVSRFNILTNPCYEKKTLHVPIKSVLGDTFNLQMPGAGKEINKEINDAITASSNAKMETGSWIYFDMRSVLKNILDTTKNAAALDYKKDLLDTANITLMALESVMNVSFIINTQKDMSVPLQTFLKTKPTLVTGANPQMQYSIKLFYLQPNKLEIFIDGFFPVVGQFVQAVLK